VVPITGVRSILCRCRRRRVNSKAVPVIGIKRTYDPTTKADGRRVLVERMWPRGMKKDALALDAWVKDVAPSPELRQWVAHKLERWPEFRRRYEKELRENTVAWSPILEAARQGTVTLLFSAHDREHNSAVVLRDFLEERLSQSKKIATRSEERRVGEERRSGWAQSEHE